jgi:hypothetical protein
MPHGVPARTSIPRNPMSQHRRSLRRSRAPGAGTDSFPVSTHARKDLQLCRQVAETLQLVLGDCGDDVLRDLHVVRVVPAPDASQLLVVEMFDGFADTWRGWGRSLALPWVEPMWRQIAQVLVLGVVMVLAPVSLVLGAPSVVSVVVVAMRLGTLFGTRQAYERGGVGYWLSALADPIAVLAVLGNVIVPRRVWRGRSTR